MHVEVKFADASGIRIIQGFTSGPEGAYAEFRYNSTKDLWEWSFTITKYILNGEFKIRTIWAYDNVGNSSGSFEPDDYVIITGCTENDTTGPELISFRILENNQELTAGDTMHVEVKYADPSGIRIIQGFTTGAEGKYAEFRYNSSKDLWEWSYTFNEYTLDGPFGIRSIWAYDNVGNSSGTYTPDDYIVFIDPFTKNLVIPEDVTEIETEAFYGNSMVVVTINDKCNRIGDRAFANCKSLWRIYIPQSVTSISDDFLQGSTRATIYCEDGTIKSTFRAKRLWIDSSVACRSVPRQERKHTSKHLRRNFPKYSRTTSLICRNPGRFTRPQVRLQPCRTPARRLRLQTAVETKTSTQFPVKTGIGIPRSTMRRIRPTSPRRANAGIP